MLRKLLTLLAIFVGFAAVAEPARAAVSPVESVRIVEATNFACSPRAASRVVQGRQSTPRISQDRAPCPKPRVVLIVPSVMLKADRAHE